MNVQPCRARHCLSVTTLLIAALAPFEAFARDAPGTRPQENDPSYANEGERADQNNKGPMLVVARRPLENPPREADEESTTVRKRKASAEALGGYVFGLRGSMTSMNRRANNTGYSVLFGDRVLATLAKGREIWQADADLALGGGSLGLEGEAGMRVEGGQRLQIDTNHALHFMLGLDLHVLGNDRLYYSTVNLPTGTFGYHAVYGKKTLFELGVSASPALIGRFGINDSESVKLGNSLQWGPHLHLTMAPLWFEARYERVEHNRRDQLSTILEMWRVSLCAHGAGLGVCGDGRFWTEHGVLLPNRDTQVGYVGVTFGFFGGPKQ